MGVFERLASGVFSLVGLILIAIADYPMAIISVGFGLIALVMNEMSLSGHNDDGDEKK